MSLTLMNQVPLHFLNHTTYCIDITNSKCFTRSTQPTTTPSMPETNDER